VRRRAVPLILSLSVGGLLLAGCSVHAEAGPTTPASSVARLAEKALEKKVGIKPDIDCGSKDVIVVQGKSITCDLTDPTTKDVYDVKITFDKVDGRDYHIDAEVAQTPKKKGGGDDASGSDAGGATVPSSQVAQLAAGALAPQIGAQQLSCQDENVPLTVGFVEKCSYTADGATHAVDVTITKFDGTNYDINAKVVS